MVQVILFAKQKQTQMESKHMDTSGEGGSEMVGTDM